MPHVGIAFGYGHTLDGLGTFQNGRHDFVGVTDFRIRDVLVLEVDGIGDSFTPRCFGMAVMHEIMFFGHKEIPAIDGMVLPSTTVVGLFVYLCRTTHWGKRHFVVVKWPAKICVHRNSWGCVQLSKEI